MASFTGGSLLGTFVLGISCLPGDFSSAPSADWDNTPQRTFVLGGHSSPASFLPGTWSSAIFLPAASSSAFFLLGHFSSASFLPVGSLSYQDIPPQPFSSQQL